MGLLAGCSSSDGDVEPIDTGDAAANEPAGKETPDVTADEAALKQLFLDYWDAMVELENSKEVDPSIFDGITTSGIGEQEVARVQALKDYGIVGRGGPEITEVTPEVDGDEGTVAACVNRDDWTFYDESGNPVKVVDKAATDAGGVAAERTADGWIIVEILKESEVRVSC